MRYFLKSAISACLLLLLAVFVSVPVTAEIAVGSNIDSRVVLAYKVNDAAAQALLPEGWKLLTLPKGPLAGANLLVAFIDRHLEIYRPCRRHIELRYKSGCSRRPFLRVAGLRNSARGQFIREWRASKHFAQFHLYGSGRGSPATGGNVECQAEFRW